MRWFSFGVRATFVAACYAATLANASPVRAAEPDGARFSIVPVGASRERGSLTLVPTSDSTTLVRIRLAHQPPGAIQPAEIHSGSCGDVDPNVRHVLTSVLSGKSDTRLDISETYLMHIPTVLIVRLSRVSEAPVACARIG